MRPRATAVHTAMEILSRAYQDHQNSRPVCPAVVTVHTDSSTYFTTRQPSTFAGPVVPDCIGNRFRLLSAFSNCSVPFSGCSDSHVRLLLHNLSDCSVSFPIALAFVFDCSATFSDCSVPFYCLVTFSDCSVPFSNCSVPFPIALAVVSDCRTSYLIF